MRDPRFFSTLARLQRHRFSRRPPRVDGRLASGTALGRSSIPKTASTPATSTAWLRCIRSVTAIRCGCHRLRPSRTAITRRACSSTSSAGRSCRPSNRLRWIALRSLTAAHSIVDVQNVGFDLLAHSVLWEVRHLQHTEDGPRVAIAPLDKRRQHRFQIGGPQLNSLGTAPGKFQCNGMRPVLQFQTLRFVRS